jgi:hypothetical protein
MEWKDVIKIVLTAIASFGGGGAIVWAFSGWLGKLWANRLMQSEKEKFEREMSVRRSQFEKELEELKNQYRKKEFVHRIQFEKEFQIYVELWDALIKVHNTAVRLRPVFKPATGRTEVEWYNDALKEFGEAYQGYATVLHSHKPFIAKEVYDGCVSIRDIAHKEGTEFTYLSPPRTAEERREYYGHAKENITSIEQKADEVCDLIKSRIGNMAIIQ